MTEQIGISIFKERGTNIHRINRYKQLSCLTINWLTVQCPLLLFVFSVGSFIMLAYAIFLLLLTAVELKAQGTLGEIRVNVNFLDRIICGEASFILCCFG